MFTSEWNPFAQKTYLANFPHEEGHRLEGDITEVDAEDVPDHDVLLAGFPCQPFSIAGVSKKNALGHPHGFERTTQGTLFYDVARIIAAKQPKAFLLENVKNLLSHDKGKTFATILAVLREELGYDVHYKVIDGRRFVPQHRERILIVGFREPCGFDLEDLRLPDAGPKLSSILHPQDGTQPAEAPYTTGAKAAARQIRVDPEHVPICRRTRRNTAPPAMASALVWSMATRSRAHCRRATTRTARKFWSRKAPANAHDG